MPSQASSQHLVQASALQRWFVIGSGLILLVTGLAKLLAAAGHAKVLATTDPLFQIPFSQLMFATGLIEVCLAVACLFCKDKKVPLLLVAWIATGFVTYRTGLDLMGWHRPCPCLGNLTDSIHVSPRIADEAMRAVAGSLFLGSYGILLYHYFNKRALGVGKDQGQKSGSQAEGN